MNASYDTHFAVQTAHELSARRESNHRSILCALRQRQLAVLKISLESTMTKKQKV